MFVTPLVVVEGEVHTKDMQEGWKHKKAFLQLSRANNENDFVEFSEEKLVEINLKLIRETR
jgi:hypothetical protein